MMGPLRVDFLIFGLAFGFNVLVCALLARWYVWPALAARPWRTALIAILWPHTSRFINLAAATINQVDSRIPHAWSLEIAWGDFIAAVLALLAIAALRDERREGITLAWVATLFGLADFANSLGQGLVLQVTNLPMRGVWYIAAGAVPPLIVAHLLALRLLRRAA
jgi:hypothetical protein